MIFEFDHWTDLKPPGGTELIYEPSYICGAQARLLSSNKEVLQTRTSGLQHLLSQSLAVFRSAADHYGVRYDGS